MLLDLNPIAGTQRGILCRPQQEPGRRAALRSVWFSEAAADCVGRNDTRSREEEQRLDLCGLVRRRQNHSTARMAAEEQLVAVEEAMVRKKKGIHSSLAGFPEGHKLPVGAVVTVLERAECDGHARVRIGKKRWVSRETAQGRVLLMPVAEAGAQGEIAGEGGAQAEVAAGGAAEKSRWMKWWCRLLLMAASGFVGFFAGWFVSRHRANGPRAIKHRPPQIRTDSI